jgi:1,5-anhydro-D-fructose reductase (1,5-anhydro-D-mannitol-forming)
MTQEPKGRLFLRKEETQQEIDPGPHVNLYGHQVRHFNAAIHGQGKPFTTGEDGIRSLAVALAVLESTKNGKSVPVSYER